MQKYDSKSIEFSFLESMTSNSLGSNRFFNIGAAVDTCSQKYNIYNAEKEIEKPGKNFQVSNYLVLGS